MSYPTKEEILAKPIKFRKGTILIVKMWKATSFKNWKSETLGNKLIKLQILIQSLSAIYRIKCPRIILSNVYAYEIRTKSIIIDQRNPSIISILHEFGHRIYGSSELKACRWSYYLFKEVFPKSLEKLHWNNHMLKK